jgi:hypothetical protein
MAELIQRIAGLITPIGVDTKALFALVSALSKKHDLALDPPSQAAPGADTIRLYLRQFAKRNMLALRSEQGREQIAMSHIALSPTALWMPRGNSTAADILGAIAPLTLGTLTIRSAGTASRVARTRRLGHVSAAAAASFAGQYENVAQITAGDGVSDGGFHLITHFMSSDAAAVAGARQFIGMTSSTAAPGNVEPSTLTQCVGVGHGSADTTMKIYRGGSVAQATIDLGVNFPANTLSQDYYLFQLFASAGSTTINYRIDRLNTGHSAEGILAGDGTPKALPNATTLLAYRAWRTNNATALAVGLDLGPRALQTDY